MLHQPAKLLVLSWHSVRTFSFFFFFFFCFFFFFFFFFVFFFQAEDGIRDLVRSRGLGFNTADEVFYADEFRALGCDVHLATADGSAGVRGFVTTAIAECRPEFDYFYACGPLPMLRALCDAVQQDGQLSFEERMGCGFGACMGCSCKTKYGNKRICKEGPVLTKGEVIW